MDNQHQIDNQYIAGKCKRIETVANNLGFDCNYEPIKILGLDYIRFCFSNNETNHYIVHDISYESITRFTPQQIVNFIINEYKWE